MTIMGWLFRRRGSGVPRDHSSAEDLETAKNDTVEGVEAVRESRLSLDPLIQQIMLIQQEALAILEHGHPNGDDHGTPEDLD